MFLTSIAFVLEKLLPLLPLSLLIFFVRIGAILFIPFSKISPQLRKISQPCTLGLRYKRCVNRMENQVWRFHSSLEAPKRLHIIDREYLDTARQTKRGLIFVSIHHHCLRLFCYWINQIDPTLQPYLVANEFAQRRRALHEFAMRACHTVFSGRFIPVNSDMRKTVRVLQQGGSILLLQDRIRPDAPLIPFLGYMVRNPLGAVRLAEMSDALIIPFITASRISFDKKKWSIHFWPHIDPRAGTTKARLIACLEQMVLNYPEVWQNWHSLKDKL